MSHCCQFKKENVIMISSRNQLKGQIKSISRGIVNAEIIIITEAGLELTSIITVGSCMQMDLQPGKEVIALIKSSDVMLAVGNGFCISTRNNIPGKIKHILSGNVSNEVVIDADGTELVSVITDSSVKRLNLAKEMEVSALIKASNVLLLCL